MFVIILQNSILRDPDMFKYKYIISTLVINYIHLNKQTEKVSYMNVAKLAEKAKISILFST